jgi:hypothetical protein
MLDTLKSPEEILQTLVKGRPPHSHDKPGFWDDFDPSVLYWKGQVNSGQCGPNGECFVCTARLAAMNLLQAKPAASSHP